MQEDQADLATTPPVVPMKANAFEIARQSNTQLLPLFPYLHPGAIVPCSASFESDGKTPTGYFLHENSVDEVAFTLGSNGRNRSGDVFVGPRQHGVGYNSPEPFFALMVITQRQAEDHEQDETMSFVCEQCSAVLLSHEFDGHTGRHGRFPALSTIVGSFESAQALNTEGVLTCRSCGHQNPAFPLPIWGWSSYVRQTRIAENSFAAMQEASR